MSFETEQFQVWLNTVINDVGRLSLEQTEEFFSKFLDKCSIEQKCFIERYVHQFMSYDLITGLPELPVKCILEYLDFNSLLACRQVCRTWNTIITNVSPLWWRLCLRMGGKIEVFNADRGTDYFFMFINLLRVLYKLDSDAGYVKQMLPQLEPEEKLQILQCDTEMVAFGTSQRRVVLVDADTFGEESLSVWRGSSPSCLASTHDFVIIGTFFGEVKIWSPHNKAHHLQELTGHTNVVTSVAVHSSHHYILSASSGDSSSVRLHCPFDMSVWEISLSPPASVLTDHVFHIEFLPDPSPGTFQFLFGTSVCVGVITVSKKEDFGVLEQHYRGPVMKYLSFATVRSDPTLLFLTSYEGTTDKPGPCLIKRLRVKGNGFCEETVVHQSPKFRQDYRILAAGKRFLFLINHRGDFKMFDTVRSDYICHFHCRPAPIPVVGLSSLLKTSCVGQADCLDGLCPESMQPGHKVLMTAGEPGIIAWQWSENLWGDVCWHSGDVILC